MFIAHFMNEKLKQELINIARSKISDDDPSHDFYHALRVMKNAEFIAKKENADLDIVIPAALFHDVVNYPKNDPRAKTATDKSALVAEEVLNKLNYSKDKIEKVKHCISTCSFSKGFKHELLEAQIVQDSDGLESTGAISIMRNFCSSGTMKIPLYNPEDPFCVNRNPVSLNHALDLFYSRLLKVKDRMYTETAKKIAEKRTKFLYSFLEELKEELEFN